MAVHLETTLTNMFEDAGQRIVSIFVAQAKANAPVASGQLAGSISAVRDGMWHWTVSTHASGANNFEYPARIEAGEPVIPTGNFTHNFGAGQEPAIWFYGTWHKKASASNRSHFMQITMSQFRI